MAHRPTTVLERNTKAACILGSQKGDCAPVFEIATRQADPHTSERRLWPWCRTTAWKRVKGVLSAAGVNGGNAMPKGLRHTFGIHGVVEAKVPSWSYMVKPWGATK